MKRNIIEIDEKKCDGCGLCIPACPEGAIQLIDGKARLVRDLYCDGLGACLGHCPQGAITVIEREAAAYDERAVMENVIKQGSSVVEQHLAHLREHGELESLKLAENILIGHEERNQALPMFGQTTAGGCPGSQNMSFADAKPIKNQDQSLPSALTHWPIQLHLISPQAPHYQGADLLLAADCVPFSLANFHQKYLAGKKLAIACPKLDGEQEIYLDKLQTLIDQAQIKSLAIMIMQVPCCSGLVQLARTAVSRASREIPLKATVVGIDGTILNEIQID